MILLFVLLNVFKVNVNIAINFISIDFLRDIYKYTNYIILVFLISGTTFLFCEISSFIFNIYHSIATTLSWVVQNDSETK